MAVVYLARHRDLDRLVALKELGAFHAADPTWAARFLRESQMAGSLSHSNIVMVLDYFEAGGTPFIAMEYLPRGSLRPCVGHLGLASIGGVLADVLAGIAHAESHGIVHRDLKPENLLLAADGRVKIADFGIAKATSRISSGGFNTATGVTVGTPGYMAPEQALATDLGPWTDLYSLGCIAYELFVGHLPFDDSTEPIARVLRHVNEPIEPARSANPSVDAAISEWIDALLVKDTRQRTRSASVAWDTLEEILIGLLGPRWRRQSALGADSPAVAHTRPGQHRESGATVESAGAPAAQLTPPSGAAIPEPQTTPPDFIPGPYTPPPDASSTDLSEVVTFEAPGPPRPVAPEPSVSRSEPPVSESQPPRAESDHRGDSSRRVAILLGAGALAVVVPVAAVVLSSGGDERGSNSLAAGNSSPTPAATLTSGPLTLTLPPGWSKSAAAAGLPGLALDSAAGAGSPEGAQLVAGIAPADTVDASLLPSGFVRGLELPTPEAVRLAGDAAAYRYNRLTVPGLDAPVSVLAAPTDAGVATVACIGSDAACIRAAETLTIRGARAYPLGPSRDYADALNRGLGELDTVVAEKTRAMRRAKERARPGRDRRRHLRRLHARRARPPRTHAQPRGRGRQPSTDRPPPRHGRGLRRPRPRRAPRTGSGPPPPPPTGYAASTPA